MVGHIVNRILLFDFVVVLHIASKTVQRKEIPGFSVQKLALAGVTFDLKVVQFLKDQ